MKNFFWNHIDKSNMFNILMRYNYAFSLSFLSEIQISGWGYHVASRTQLSTPTRGCASSWAGARVGEEHLPDWECTRLCFPFPHLSYEGKISQHSSDSMTHFSSAWRLFCVSVHSVNMLKCCVKESPSVSCLHEYKHTHKINHIHTHCIKDSDYN